MKHRNIVKKHTFSFNKPKIELDRKKEMRKNGDKQDKYWEEDEMIAENKRFCRLTEEGLAAWSKHNIEADPMQVFTIEYQ